MDGMNHRPLATHTLAYRLMMRFALCMAALMVLALPLLYLITTHYYAEDLTRLVMKYGATSAHIDLEEDTLMGMFIQFFSIIALLLVAVFIVMRYVPQRLWKPFRSTLDTIERFSVEKAEVPRLAHTGTKEFDELNTILTELMTKSVKSYRLQKEFSENASHELQTPLAVAQMKVEALQQDPSLTQRQAEDLQAIYMELRRMSRISRSLLLLSKLDNQQFAKDDRVEIGALIHKMLPQWQTVSGPTTFSVNVPAPLVVTCNESLIESLFTNLVVNAIRHSRAGSTVNINVEGSKLSVSNESAHGPLNKEHIFSRFYHSCDSSQGYGLGLAIVKSICNFHHWKVDYSYEEGRHVFTVDFGKA